MWSMILFSAYAEHHPLFRKELVMLIFAYFSATKHTHLGQQVECSSEPAAHRTCYTHAFVLDV